MRTEMAGTKLIKRHWATLSRSTMPRYFGNHIEISRLVSPRQRLNKSHHAAPYCRMQALLLWRLLCELCNLHPITKDPLVSPTNVITDCSKAIVLITKLSISERNKNFNQNCHHIKSFYNGNFLAFKTTRTFDHLSNTLARSNSYQFFLRLNALKTSDNSAFYTATLEIFNAFLRKSNNNILHTYAGFYNAFDNSWLPCTSYLFSLVPYFPLCLRHTCPFVWNKVLLRSSSLENSSKVYIFIYKCVCLFKCIL